MVKKYILWQKENTNEFTVDISCAWKVIKFISVFCMCLALFIGCGEAELDDKDPFVDNLPNLDDPKVREQILAEAIDEDNLQTRQSSSGEELFFAPNQSVPYTGWVKTKQNDSDDNFWYNRLWQAQDGKRHGIFLKWYITQQNIMKGFYKEGIPDGLWALWTKNGEKHQGFVINEGASFARISPDGKTLASSIGDGTICLWDVVSGTLKHTLEGHKDNVDDIDFSPDGKTLASSIGDGTICLWDVVSGTLKHTLEGHPEGPIQNRFYGYVSISPDGKTLASHSGDAIRLWDVATGTLKHSLNGHDDDVNSVAFSPDGKTLASGGSDGTVILWDVEIGALKMALTVHGSIDDFRSVAFSPDGKTLASGNLDGTIILWDVVPLRLKHILNGHRSVFPSELNDVVVAFSPDGKTLASFIYNVGEARGRAQFWDVVTGTLSEEVSPGGLSYDWGFEISPDWKTYVTRGRYNDANISLWDLKSGTRTLKIEENWVLDGNWSDLSLIGFSSDGKMYVSRHGGNIIHIWNIP